MTEFLVALVVVTLARTVIRIGDAYAYRLVVLALAKLHRESR